MVPLKIVFRWLLKYASVKLAYYDLWSFISSFQGHATSWQRAFPSHLNWCQGGERRHQEEQEIQAHCQGSAEKSDKIERKFDVQDVRGRCCEHVFNLTSFVKWSVILQLSDLRLLPLHNICYCLNNEHSFPQVNSTLIPFEFIKPTSQGCPGQGCKGGRCQQPPCGLWLFNPQLVQEGGRSRLRKVIDCDVRFFC